MEISEPDAGKPTNCDDGYRATDARFLTRPRGCPVPAMAESNRERDRMLTRKWSGTTCSSLRGIALTPLLALVLASCLAVSPLDSPASHAEAAARALTANSDSAAAAFHAALRRLTSDEFEQRNARRLDFQRRGYAAILHELLRRNAAGAFLAMVRTKAQLDIHLPQNTLMVTVPVLGPPPGDPRFEIFAPPPTAPMAFPLIEDRRFPENPWRK